MARPPKRGLDYFPHDVNYYDDFRIVDLLYEFGTLGQTVYDVILTIVYKNGYYVELPIEKLVQIVVRTIGNKWAKKDAVAQVILYCSEIGLFDESLLKQNVITSVGIQRRYKEVTARQKIDMSKYWLLENDGQPLESASGCLVSATETWVSATETGVSATETTPNKIKQNKSKVNKNKVVVPSELIDAWSAYSEMRVKIKKPMTDRAAQLVLDKLQKLAPNNYSMQNAILEQSTMNSWQGVFPLKEDKTSGWGGESSYDIDEMERKLLYGEIKFKEGANY